MDLSENRPLVITKVPKLVLSYWKSRVDRDQKKILSRKQDAVEFQSREEICSIKAVVEGILQGRSNVPFTVVKASNKFLDDLVKETRKLNLQI